MLNAIETSQLQTLVAVAESKSFSRAGERLHVTQSAISQSVKNLEIKTKVKLFHRSGKQILSHLQQHESDALLPQLQPV